MFFSLLPCNLLPRGNFHPRVHVAPLQYRCGGVQGQLKVLLVDLFLPLIINAVIHFRKEKDDQYHHSNIDAVTHEWERSRQ